MMIRERTPRLVLRTACETLPAATRDKVLLRSKPIVAKRKAAAAK